MKIPPQWGIFFDQMVEFRAHELRRANDSDDRRNCDWADCCCSSSKVGREIPRTSEREDARLRRANVYARNPAFPRMRIPMMPITQSDLMPISAERSDAGLSQCERVIDISQDGFGFSARFFVPGAGLLQ